MKKALFVNVYANTVRLVDLEDTIFEDNLKDLLVEGMLESERAAARENVVWGQEPIQGDFVLGQLLFDKEAKNRPNPITTTVGDYTIVGNYVLLSVGYVNIDSTLSPEMWAYLHGGGLQPV